jgi:transcriptional regulator with XRE-family HTH domain
MTFGEILLEFRARYNLTQKQLAEILGVGANMICRYECETSKPSAKNKIMFELIMKKWEATRRDLQM